MPLRQMALRDVVTKDTTGPMEIEGGGAGPAGPSSAVAELKASAAAEPEPERIEPEAGADSRWIKPIGTYARRELAHAEDSTSYG
jgi:hypothetical protein